MFNRRIRDLLFQVKSGSFSPVILLLRFRPYFCSVLQCNDLSYFARFFDLSIKI